MGRMDYIDNRDTQADLCDAEIERLKNEELGLLNQQLCELTQHWTCHEDVPLSQQSKCKSIGKEIHKYGGMIAMREAFYEAKAANPAASAVQYYWHGIGDWQM